MQRVRVIDSHTEGEPTRVVLDGYPDLGKGSARDRLRVFVDHHDGFRSALCREPRGFDAMVGALLLPPNSKDAIAQVIFFNNVGTLGMCAHGTMGVGETLCHLGRISKSSRDRHKIETPVGDVHIAYDDDGLLWVENIESYRLSKQVSVLTESHGEVMGDISWGGNWFFLIEEHGQDLVASNIHALTDYAWDVRQSLLRKKVRGDDGGEIDHVELFSAPTREDADSKNFVLCPGREYDRSPCGTGTSAKMACLAADGRLVEGRVWRQESIIGSRFLGTVKMTEKGVLPTIGGRAWITAESTLLMSDDDPFREGICL